ncbi:hypothetical protein EAH_00050670 [Eimeria acervulina]|uniref:Uncharacterized protein n=1 Tax=Eimeria acervulina TaxID=5801 RepID=U6GJJ2_EIMAC|nr:hypothetical protein EAH_00050670 [Eimeria acervulina]CDI80330.1 hypothetical protein EAH_00050670 [Eimeria acervulina]
MHFYISAQQAAMSGETPSGAPTGPPSHMEVDDEGPPPAAAAATAAAAAPTAPAARTTTAATAAAAAAAARAATYAAEGVGLEEDMSLLPLSAGEREDAYSSFLIQRAEETAAATEAEAAAAEAAAAEAAAAAGEAAS